MTTMNTGIDYERSDWTYTAIMTDENTFDNKMLRLRIDGYLAINVRGKKCRSIQGLYDEFSAAFQFPYYFGENWPAFDECMSDLDWLSRGDTSLNFGKGIILGIRDSDQVLSETFKSYPRALGILADILESAADYFRTPYHAGETWDHDPIPFHVLLHGNNAHSFRAWEKLVTLH